MKFVMYFKRNPEVKEYFYKCQKEGYRGGIKLIDLLEVEARDKFTHNLKPVYVWKCKGPLVTYLISKVKFRKYLTHHIGWKI